MNESRRKHWREVLKGYGINPDNFVLKEATESPVQFRLMNKNAFGYKYGPNLNILDNRLYTEYGYDVKREKGHYVNKVLGEFWLDGDSLYHREDGPARIVGKEKKYIFYWHGKVGLENFPDYALAKIGNTVI